MAGDDAETASQALCELARLVVRDGVDSDHLEDYMRGLLSNHLIELHASCRHQAMVLARCFAGLAAEDVAAHLLQSACELERARTALRASLRQEAQQQRQADSVSEAQIVRAIRGQPSQACRETSSWVPELVAAVVFISLAVCLLSAKCNDFALRLLAGSGYGCLGLIYAAAAIYLAWRNARPDNRR